MTDSYVYIVECSDGTLYTGWTNRPLQRIRAHSEGRGAKYTKGRGPVKLVYLEALEDKSVGLIREAKIKKMIAAKKRQLILESAERTVELEQQLLETERRQQEHSENKRKQRKTKSE